MPSRPESSRYLVPELVPHTGIARLLRDIVVASDGFIEAIGEIPETYPLVTAGYAPCFVGLELAAQAAAALGALERRTRDPVGAARLGYLVRIREAVLLRPALPVATPLGVTARVEAAMGPLAVHRVAVTVGGVEFLRAQISTYRDPQ